MRTSILQNNIGDCTTHTHTHTHDNMNGCDGANNRCVCNSSSSNGCLYFEKQSHVHTVAKIYTHSRLTSYTRMIVVYSVRFIVYVQCHEHGDSFSHRGLTVCMCYYDEADAAVASATMCGRCTRTRSVRQYTQSTAQPLAMSFSPRYGRHARIFLSSSHSVGMALSRFACVRSNMV